MKFEARITANIESNDKQKTLWNIQHCCGARHETYYTCVFVHNIPHSNCNLFKHSVERQTKRKRESEKHICSKYSTPKWNLLELSLRAYLRMCVWHGKFMKINPISALNHTYSRYEITCRHIIWTRKKISNKFSSLFAILHFMCFADITIFIVNWFFCIFHAAAATAVDVDDNVQIFFYVFMVIACARVRVFAFAWCELIHTQ